MLNIEMMMRKSLLVLLAASTGLLCSPAALSSATPPHEYYVLAPEHLSGDISVMSLEASNTIAVGSYQVTLGQYETATIPAAALSPGYKLTGSGFFTVGSNQNAADLLVPDDFAGTQFVIPHATGNHRYFFLSPTGSAAVTIRVGANTYNVTTAQGVVTEFDAGSASSVAAIVTSTVPIVVSHVAYQSGLAIDAFAVSPAANDLYGLRSQNTLVAALTNGTVINAYASDGTTTTFSLDAGQQANVSIGSGAAQGQGSGLHLVASAPIGAIQFNDGDGSESTVFWSANNFARRFGIPVNAQYLAVVCTQSNVTLTLLRGQNPPVIQTCSGTSTFPGKVYFGASTSGANILAGGYLISSGPAYLTYEVAITEDEVNSLGFSLPASGATPVLNAIASPTSSNPQSVTGTAGANQSVRLFVNGKLSATTTANASGAYAFNAPLLDGSNTIYATAIVAGTESDPSNVLSLSYVNSVSRAQGGTISGHVVWTPGAPAAPYVVSSNLIIAAGASLTLQPGTTLQFASGRSLTATGQLLVVGTSVAPVVFTSSLASPARGSWAGLIIGATSGSIISNSRIEFAVDGIRLDNTSATIRNSTIRMFSLNGIYLNGANANASLVQGNTIDNENATGNCIWSQQSNPQIIGNLLTRCSVGLYVTMNGAPVVNGNNIITANTRGLSLFGNNAYTPQPIVSGNQIFANTSSNYFTASFLAGATSLRLSATGNWWGSTNPTTIAGTITDRSDTVALPTVDYSNFLGGANGSPVVGNYLIGYFTAPTTTLTAGLTYDVLGTVVVPAGKTLVIPAGTTIRSHVANTSLAVEGLLQVQGTVSQPVIFTSGRAAPARGDWKGIEALVSTGTVSINYAQIEYPAIGVSLSNGGSGTIRNSLVRRFTTDGIFVNGAGGASSIIEGNTIDNENATGNCVWSQQSNLQAIGNLLTRCNVGLYVTMNGAPVVNGNNIITANTRGISLFGNNAYTPQPIVSGNQIFANTSSNYHTASFPAGAASLRLIATGNWWGSTNPTIIAGTITDRSDTASLPTVDYSNFLGSANGSPVVGNYLMGYLTAPTTTLAAGLTYDVLGTLVVPVGKTLVIPAGTTIRSHVANTSLTVEGSLQVQGTVSQPVIFTSGRAAPARGDWKGISAATAAASITIDYAVIEWASTGVDIQNATGTVTNSVIRYFSTVGVYVKGVSASASLIQGNTIDNLNDTVDCIESENSSPTIKGNTIINCNKGINLTSSANATLINANNIITSNVYGIYADGNSSACPGPIVNGNQIFANSTYNFYTRTYCSTGPTQRINATGNWWGSTNPTAIAGTIYDRSESVSLPTVDYSNFLGSANGSPVVGNHLIGYLTAPTTTLTAGLTYDVLGTLVVPVGKTLVIPAGTTIRSHVANTELTAEGSLQVQGTVSQPVIFTSGRAMPARGDWNGIGAATAAASITIDYAVIEWASTGVDIQNATGTVTNSVIRYFSTNGVYVKGVSANASLIQGNTIDNVNDTVDCIEAENSSPTIKGNTITNCNKGINVTSSANATTINANNIITSNVYGIYADGNNSGCPAPIVNGNQIFANSTYNFYTRLYCSTGPTQRINATGNWWGSTNPTTIAGTIYDRSESASLPTVDYSNFLGSANGSAVVGNHLIGHLTAPTTTLTAGLTYDVLGTLVVPVGKTLVIPAGTTIRSHVANTELTVEGSLQVQGSASQPVVFTSGRATPARGDWNGIGAATAAGSININYAVIEWASTGVDIQNATGIVTNSVIRYFSTVGVYVKGVSASASLIQGNTIDNLNDTVDCIESENSSPTIKGNTITNCNKGINLTSTANSTVINANNIITSNVYGIYADGAGGVCPGPIVNGNQIFANSTYNFYTRAYCSTGPTQRIDATGNWWGVVDPLTIARSVYDLTDNFGATTLPIVDFSGYLNGPLGTIFTANQLIGRLTATTTTLSAGQIYDVLGTVYIQAGKSLVIPAGAVLRFYEPEARLVIDGSLQVQGTASARAVFTSGLPLRSKGDWYGILVRSTATNVVLDNASLEWSVSAVEVQTATATISNSLIQNFSVDGIRMTGGGTGSQITNNYIDNYDKTAHGIVLVASSPSVTGNRVHRTDKAIYLSGASNPSITGNILTDNKWGIYLHGASSNIATAVPRPTITGNDIFGNSTAQLEVNAYGATNPAVIDATNNWWGTATPAVGTQIRMTGGSPVASLNFSSPAASALNGPTSGIVVLSEYYISPNADGIKDSTTIQGTLSRSSQWTLSIQNEGGTVLRTYTGTGTAVSAVWDGRNTAGVLQPNGRYNCVLTVPWQSSSVIVGVRLATLDVAPPALAITAPTSGAVLADVLTVPVIGTATDALFAGYTLDYAAAATPTTWVLITNQAATVVNGNLSTWTVGSTDGSIGLTGSFTLRLRSTDLAGNASVVQLPVVIDNIAAGAITQNLALIKPLLGQQLTVSFAISGPGTAALQIYPDLGGSMVREISQTFSSGGPKTLSWDGRDAASQYVPDEAYRYVLVLSDATRQTTYDPPDTVSVGSGVGTVDTAFNAYRNDSWKMTYTLSDAKARVRMQVSGCTSATHFPYNWVPFTQGASPLIWDGRDADGQIVSGSCDIYFDPPDPLRRFSVIVKGNTPAITGAAASPNIEVKSNPYSITHSYEQISKIIYRVDQDAYVTVKLLPPNVTDPSSPQAIVLTQSELRYARSGGLPVDHTVEWKGYDDLDTNNVLVSDEGSYTFAIQATSVSTGASTLYRGALNLRQ